MSTWTISMEQVLAKARLASADVLDISFADGNTWEVYVAASQKDRQYGLSYIDRLDLAGMLFYYETESYIPFTMHGMQFDIDIAWYKKDGKLIQLKTVSKETQDPIFCQEAFTYVLEAPASSIPTTNLKVL